MAMNTRLKIVDRKYELEEHDLPTTAPAHKPTSVIKYMGPRTLAVNHPSAFQGSLRSFALSNVGSNFTVSPGTTRHGFASIVRDPLTTDSSIHSIDREHIIDEQRALSKLNEKLTENILECCSLDVNNRAEEIQIELLEKHSDKNSLIIEKMFQTEIQTARQMIEDTLRYKSELERKLNDIHQTTLANDELYQQLLSRRNATNKEIFEYQRQLAQTRAESEFLRCRIQQFTDEISFYTLKNNLLEARKVKLTYELDEELYAKQVLEVEFTVLENEKITNEDIHSASIDEIRGSIDIKQLGVIQSSSNYLRDQLTHELRRIQSDYEKKLQTYRSELHRKFELEAHRSEIQKRRPLPAITREHEETFEQYKRERRDIEQQRTMTRERINEIRIRIETIEKKMHEDESRNQPRSNSQRNLAMLEQVIHERERQLNEALRIRTSLKQQTESYREKVNRYQTRTTQSSFESEQLTVTQPPRSILRSSQETKFERSQQELPMSRPVQPVTPTPRTESSEVTPLQDPTLIPFADFVAERDCQELNKIFDKPNIDELSIINILCNRSVAQRVIIRETYETLFGQNLGDIFESRITGNAKEIFKILLLSAVGHDCYELRRVLKQVNIEEKILIEIFLSRSNKHIKAIVDYYYKLFHQTLEQDIIGDRNTPSKKIFLALLQANRPEDNDEIDADKVSNDARNLHQTNSKWRTDASTFIQLLSNRSNANLKQIFDAYQQFGRNDIEQSILIDTDADLSRTLMAIVRIVRNRPRFFAYELRKSLKGVNSNEDNLNRIIISRCEIDTVQIKMEYIKVANRTLFDHIQTDTYGSYKRTLLELLRQRMEAINNDSPLNLLLKLSELPTKNRRSVQWQESTTNKQTFGRSVSDRNLSETKPFDRNNQAKSNSILTLNTRPPYIEERLSNRYSDLIDDTDD